MPIDRSEPGNFFVKSDVMVNAPVSSVSFLKGSAITVQIKITPSTQPKATQTVL